VGRLVPPLTGLTRHMFIDLVIVIKSGKVGTHGLFVCSMVALRFDDVGRVIDHH
jgi:hypothetical protein